MKRHRTPVGFLWTVCLISPMLSTGWSGTTAYFSYSEFSRACQGVPGVRQWFTFTDFSEEALFSSYEYGPQRAAVTISGVTFGGRYLQLGGLGLWNYDAGQPMTIHFSRGARAFGALLSSNGQSPYSKPFYSNFTGTVTTDTGVSYRFIGPAMPGSTFVGVVSTTPMTHLTFSDGGPFPITPGVGLHEETIDMVEFVADSVPLPSLRLITQPEFQLATLSWPATNAGFVVQQTTDPGSTNWVTIDRPFRHVYGPFCWVTVPYTGTSGTNFYRLILQQWQ